VDSQEIARLIAQHERRIAELERNSGDQGGRGGGGGGALTSTHWIVETEAALNALTRMREGHTGYTKDADKSWVYDGTNWICTSHYNEEA
jgi:hypothetical protein